MKKLSRRSFLGHSLAAAGIAALPKALHAGNTSAHIRSNKIAQKVIVLGIDGMDPTLTQKMMDQGELPNFKKLAAQGHFGPLKTTMPPQSPVAWSSFITGTNPGGHGIFDFIHRDPSKFLPYLSTSRSFPGTKNFSIGDYNIPLDSGRVDLMRRGTAFWDVLLAKDIATTAFSLPANFPVETRGDNLRAISGMGTPDLLGGYGRYTYITEERVDAAEELSGGLVTRVLLEDNKVQTVIEGPKSPFHKVPMDTTAELKITRDPLENSVKIEVQGQTLLLEKGEWSDWVALSFQLLPVLASIGGIVRFYVKDVHPKLKIYVSPVQVDPMDPALPICNPAGYSKELAQAIGRFYTQGLPADTKALAEGTLNSYEFLQQSKLVLAENLRAFDYEFSNFHEGCFVFYFSSLDQNSHMLMRCMQPDHPLYEPNAPDEVKSAIRWYYKAMDEVLGKAMTKVDNYTTLMVLSDHGFTDFTREFNLSTWLVEKGFTVLSRPDKMDEIDFYQYIDWKKTKAYALGINGIYLNLKGREQFGHVEEHEVEGILNAITKELLEVRDPQNGKAIMRGVYKASDIYSGPYAGLAPDLLMGYDSGYRISDEAILGKFPKEIIRDRTNLWASDHCMDPSAVPGVFFCNKPIAQAGPGIWDLAPSILNAFGVAAPKSMTGKVVI